MRTLGWIMLGLLVALPLGCKAKTPDKPAGTAAKQPDAAPDKPAESTAKPAESKDGWISLFDGKSLDGWKANEDSESFKVVDGAIVAQAAQQRCHLFYVGPVKDANFKNFEFQADVMTTPGSNGGIYFHTEFLPEGWPTKGYEVQVNNTHKDPKKTGGLYAVSDVFEVPAKDDEWFTERIVVRGKHVQTFVNDKLLVDYTEPDDVVPPKAQPGRLVSSGTFGFQAHDPNSKVFFKNIKVKPLPDDAP